jgi:hypothetical protein
VTARLTLARALVVLAAFLGIVSSLAGYVRFQGLDTPTVEETAGDLIADREIRDEIAATLVEQLFENVDVEAALREQLPAQQQGLASPIAAALRLGADGAARRLLERPRVQKLWVRSIVATHENLLRVLDDDLGAVTTVDGSVVLDLRPLVIRLGETVAVVGRLDQRLAANPEAGRIKILEADQLETAQDATQLLKVLGTWLWLVPLMLSGAALWVARGHRRAILRLIGIGAIVAGLFVLVARRLAGSVLVDELAPSGSVEIAAGDAWDILTSLLRDSGFTQVGFGVILLVAVWLSGPSPSATGSRRWLAPYVERAELAFGGAAALLLLLVWWGPTAQTHRWQLVIAAAIVLALGVEVLRRQTRAEFPDADMQESSAALRRRLGL